MARGPEDDACRTPGSRSLSEEISMSVEILSIKVQVGRDQSGERDIAACRDLVLILILILGLRLSDRSEWLFV